MRHLFERSGISRRTALIAAGGNDIINAINKYGVTTPTGVYQVATVVNQAEANTVAAVKTLWGLGARNLLFYEVPDLGLAPRFYKTSAQAWASYFALSFDQTVLDDLGFLKPYGLKEYALDAYHGLDDIHNNPAYYYSTFGIKFTDVTDPCWKGTFTGGLASGKLCSTTLSDQDQYLFWDLVHPTGTGHLLTADIAAALLPPQTLAVTAAFATSAPSVLPEPPTWAMMFLGFLGLGLAGYRTSRKTASSAV
jgi:phospholipase/lecithinase/hemolysin